MACVLHLSSDSSGKRVDFCVTLTCECRHDGWVALRSDHNASSTTSGPGHADQITFRSEACLRLFLQCECGQHPDTGHMLIPNVNAAIKCTLVIIEFLKSSDLLINWMQLSAANFK